MDAATRKAKLIELKSHDRDVAMTGIPLRYKGQTHVEKAYNIPLDFLIYNKYNGRIGTEVLSYEKQNSTLDPEKEADRKIIENFLWDSKEERNKTTMDSLKKIGQQRYGIVTADGIIVDGNRRAMLLNKLFHEHVRLGHTYEEVQKCQYFLAIILPEDATEKDIQQLETIYQMGEDDKLDYNPIEKYLKCKALEQFFSVDAIADFMSEKPGKIKEWLSILKLMEEYLETYEYDGIYTRLEKTEGPFVDLNGYLDSYGPKRGGANTRTVDWLYEDSDLSDLKLVCFDYIRARYEGKDFREIAKTGKEGSIFHHKSLWESFLHEHQTQVPQDEKTVEEFRREYPGEDLSKLLKKRDNDWLIGAGDQLKGNLRKHTRKLEDKRASNRPAELIERALSALQSVDYDQDSFFAEPSIKENLKKINSLAWDLKKLLDRERG